MICDTCAFRSVREMTGLVYCKAKHIECSVKSDDTFCSRYQGSMDADEEKPLQKYRGYYSGSGSMVVLASDISDARDKLRAIRVSDIDISVSLDTVELVGGAADE